MRSVGYELLVILMMMEDLPESKAAAYTYRQVP